MNISVFYLFRVRDRAAFPRLLTVKFLSTDLSSGEVHTRRYQLYKFTSDVLICRFVRKANIDRIILRNTCKLNWKDIYQEVSILFLLEIWLANKCIIQLRL